MNENAAEETPAESRFPIKLGILRNSVEFTKTFKRAFEAYIVNGGSPINWVNITIVISDGQNSVGAADTGHDLEYYKAKCSEITFERKDRSITFPFEDEMKIYDLLIKTGIDLQPGEAVFDEFGDIAELNHLVNPSYGDQTFTIKDTSSASLEVDKT